MVCNHCGAYNDPQATTCTVCGAPLQAEPAAHVPEEPEPVETAETERPSWGFVRSPRWPKPSFDINSVDELPEVEEYVRPHDPNAPAPAREDAERPQAYEPPSRGFRNVEPSRRFDPQPAQGQQQNYPSTAPVGSVGGYDEAPQPYQRGFGRAPQRMPGYGAQTEEADAPAPRKPQAAHYPPAKGTAAKSAARSRTAYRSKKNKNTLFYAVGGVLLVALLVLGGILISRNYGGVGGFFRSVFGGSPILKDAKITEGVNDKGVECYIVTVYARAGNTVTVRLNGQEVSGVINSSNEKEVRIPKADFLPSTPVEGTTEQLVPDITVTTKDGEVFPVEIAPIQVQVPVLSLTVTEPSAASVAVGKAAVTFAGTVNDGSVGVFVEGQPLTVNEDGTFSGEYALSDLGVYTLTLEARKNGYQIARQTFNVDYSQAEANIDVDASTLRAPSGSDTATVKGTTDAGATLSVTGPSGVTVGAPNVNEATGVFSFTVQMAENGHYSLEVTVTKDGRATTGTLNVERAPDYAAYTASVHKMDYSRMMNETLHKASYKCIGKVAEVVQTEPYTIARLTTDSGDLLFEYHNTAATVDATDGKTYNVFGDYAGIDETTGLPKIYCWFITKNG